MRHSLAMVYGKRAAREPRLAHGGEEGTACSPIEGLATAPAPFFQQPEECGQAHEDHRGAEHPAWLAAVHQPTKEERAENPAYIETRRDDAEHASGRTGRGSPAHEHIAGRLYDPV